MDISDGDLVRLARDGDPVAFRLLVERHQPMMRARAAGLSRNSSDVDDIVQESFLQAFVALDRLREPAGFAALGQELYSDDYRGTTITFRAEFRTADGRAGLFLRVNEGEPIRGPITDRSVFGDPDNNIVAIPASGGWAEYEVSARVPGDSDAFVFGVFLAGAGRIEVRNPELAVDHP